MSATDELLSQLSHAMNPGDLDPEALEAGARQIAEMPDRTPLDLAGRYSAWILFLEALNPPKDAP